MTLEADRHACEVRYAEVLKRRGQEAVTKLVESVNALRRQIRESQKGMA